MTARQKSTLARILDEKAKSYDRLEIHHGDCIGADAEFHEICIKRWPHALHVVLHPPLNPRKRAFCTYSNQSEVPAKDYLERNREIVDAVDEMIAGPKELEEQLRSGTWATVRYARKQKVTGGLLAP